MSYQRKFLRAPVLQNSLLQFEDEVVVVKLEDISEGGAAIVSPKLITQGECSLLVPLKRFLKFSDGHISHENTDVLRINAKIIPQIRDACLEGYKIALEFQQMSLADAKLIRSYVEIASKNLNFLVSLQSSQKDEGLIIKQKALDELGWFPNPKNFTDNLARFHKNAQWV